MIQCNFKMTAEEASGASEDDDSDSCAAVAFRRLRVCLTFVFVKKFHRLKHQSNADDGTLNISDHNSTAELSAGLE